MNDNYSELCEIKDCDICLVGMCCSFILNTKTSYEISTNKKYKCIKDFWCTPIVLDSFYNKKCIDREFDIDNSNIYDCLITTCCFPCSTIQNYNNLQTLKQNYEFSSSIIQDSDIY